MKTINQSIITRAAIALLLNLFTTMTAWAGNVNYYDPTAVAGEQTKTATNLTAITSSTTVLGAEGKTTWYYVTDTVTIENRINVSGTVNIILVDSCYFTASKGIHVANNEKNSNTLNIYAQSAGSTCGMLTASHSDKDAAIGGNGGDFNSNGEDSGTITIYGGKITVNGNLGGGEGGDFNTKPKKGKNLENSHIPYGLAGKGGNGTVAIYGGNITVNGNIGGGEGGSFGIKGISLQGDPGSGSISLKWTNRSDLFYASRYRGIITLLNVFVDEDCNEYEGQYDSSPFDNETLMPIISRNDIITISNTSCLKANKKKADEGNEVTLTAINGYTVSNVTVTDADNGNVSVTHNQNGTWTFTMPAKSVTVTATATKTHYRITESKGVSLIVNDNETLVQDGITYYKLNASIQLVLTPPNEAYELQSVSVKRDDNGNEIDTTLSGSTYSFTMPAADITLSATYAINTTGLTLLEGTTAFTVTKGISGSKDGDFVLYLDDIEDDDLDEGCTRLLDGKYSSTDNSNFTKWCLSPFNQNNGNSFNEDNPCYIEFNTAKPVIPKKYVLITGNDTKNYQGRNPKSWKILAKESKDDKTWTVIAKVANNQTMENENYTGYAFNFDNADDSTYQYFRFEIYSTQSSSVMQLSEMQMYVKDTSDYELADITLYTDGNWQTLCLPFSLTKLKRTPLEGFTVMEIDTEEGTYEHATGIDEGALYLNFKPATSIEAGKPYIVKKMDAPVDENSTPTYTATRGTEGTLPQQGYANLIDGHTNGNRWRTSHPTDSYCEFNAAKPVQVTGYTLTTGNQGTEGDPTMWTLKAKLNKEDAWTVIDSRDANNNNGDALPSGRTAGKEYTIQNPGAYQYFRFDVSKAGGGSFMCLSELTMHGFYLGDPVNVENPTFKGVVISSSEPVPVTSSDGLVTFSGSYSAKDIDSGDKSIFLLGSKNKLHNPDGSAATLGNYRACLSVKSPVNLQLLTDIVLGRKNATPDSNLNGDTHVDIIDITTLIDKILNNCPPVPTITTVVSNVGLSL